MCGRVRIVHVAVMELLLESYPGWSDLVRLRKKALNLICNLNQFVDSF